MKSDISLLLVTIVGDLSQAFNKSFILERSQKKKKHALNLGKLQCNRPFARTYILNYTCMYVCPSVIQ